MLDETMSGESMALEKINKINSRLKFLHRKNKFLTPALRRLLCNALTQTHLDYASSAWYSNLTQKSEKQDSNHAEYMHSVFSAARKNPYFEKRV